VFEIVFLPASAMIGIFGAAAHTDLAVAAISGGLKRQSKTNKTTEDKVSTKEDQQKKKAHVIKPKSGFPKVTAERA